MKLNVIEDVHVGGTHWRMDFFDGTSVVVDEDTKVSPPVYRKVSGDFTPARIEAIERYSHLKVV